VRAQILFNEALQNAFDALATSLIGHPGAPLGLPAPHPWRTSAGSKTSAGSADAAATRNREIKALFFREYLQPSAIGGPRRSCKCLEELSFTMGVAARCRLSMRTEQTEARHVVLRYIAGMTDQFLLRQHHERFGSSSATQFYEKRGV